MQEVTDRAALTNSALYQDGHSEGLVRTSTRALGVYDKIIEESEGLERLWKARRDFCWHAALAAGMLLSWNQQHVIVLRVSFVLIGI